LDGVECVVFGVQGKVTAWNGATPQRDAGAMKRGLSIPFAG
jgi:hypothetical protein